MQFSQIINRNVANVSPCKTPATMSKKLVSPSCEQTMAFVSSYCSGNGFLSENYIQKSASSFILFITRLFLFFFLFRFSNIVEGVLSAYWLTCLTATSELVSSKSTYSITFTFRLILLKGACDVMVDTLERCLWCNCYRRRKWTRRHEFKSWTRLIAFHIALIPLEKVWIQLFSLHLWVNSRAD